MLHGILRLTSKQKFQPDRYLESKPRLEPLDSTGRNRRGGRKSNTEGGVLRSQICHKPRELATALRIHPQKWPPRTPKAANFPIKSCEGGKIWGVEIKRFGFKYVLTLRSPPSCVPMANPIFHWVLDHHPTPFFHPINECHEESSFCHLTVLVDRLRLRAHPDGMQHAGNC
jgi:hypothetical protein